MSGNAERGSAVGSLVVLDTNILIAAGFRPLSDSARIVRLVDEGVLHMAWNDQTRHEIEQVVEHIPPLRGLILANLFREEDRYRGDTHPSRFSYISDRDDRKFAALADVAGAVLITLDEHLLGTRNLARIPILTPREFVMHGWEP